MPGNDDDIIRKRAEHFGRGDAHGHWVFAADVACCVRPGGAGQGGPRNDDRSGRTGDRQRKVSARLFAELAGQARRSIGMRGVSHNTVLAYLDAWDRAAGAGLVPPSASLAPDSDPPLPPAERFAEFWIDSRQIRREPEPRPEPEPQGPSDDELQELLDNPPPDRSAAARQAIDGIQRGEPPVNPPGPPGQEDICAKVGALLVRMKDPGREAVRWLRGAPQLDEGEVDLIRLNISQVRAILDMIQSLAEHGGITDERIRQFLEGGA